MIVTLAKLMELKETRRKAIIPLRLINHNSRIILIRRISTSTLIRRLSVEVGYI